MIRYNAFDILVVVAGPLVNVERHNWPSCNVAAYVYQFFGSPSFQMANSCFAFSLRIAATRPHQNTYTDTVMKCVLD